MGEVNYRERALAVWRAHEEAEKVGRERNRAGEMSARRSVDRDVLRVALGQIFGRGSDVAAQALRNAAWVEYAGRPVSASHHRTSVDGMILRAHPGATATCPGLQVIDACPECGREYGDGGTAITSLLELGKWVSVAESLAAACAKADIELRERSARSAVEPRRPTLYDADVHSKATDVILSYLNGEAGTHHDTFLAAVAVALVNELTRE